MILIRSPTPARSVPVSCGKCSTFIPAIGSLPHALSYLTFTTTLRRRHYYPHATEEKTKEQRFCDVPDATPREGLEDEFECWWFDPEPEAAVPLCAAPSRVLMTTGFRRHE